MEFQAAIHGAKIKKPVNMKIVGKDSRFFKQTNSDGSTTIDLTRSNVAGMSQQEIMQAVLTELKQKTQAEGLG